MENTPRTACFFISPLFPALSFYLPHLSTSPRERGKCPGYKNNIRINCARITRTNIDNGYTVA